MSRNDDLFPYQPFPCDPTPAYPGKEYHRPMLDVRVIGRSDSLDISGLVDTGAAECILPHSVREAIAPGRLRGVAVGIIHDFAGRPHALEYGRVDLEVTLKGRPYTWSAIVAFDDRDEAIWGHTGFLEFFNVTFYGSARAYRLRLREPERLPRPMHPSR